MTRTTFILFLIAIIAIAGGSVWYLVSTSRAALDQPAPTGTPAEEVNEGSAIYTNGTYGFSLVYPSDAAVSYEFDPSYHLGTAWRANARAESPGTSIVSIVPYSVESDPAYPRYFNAMVRVGASIDPDDVAACEKAGKDTGEEALADVTINGHTWKAFSFQDAGMMQYASGVSYRTVHEGACIALEKVRTGSSYRDVPSPEDIPDEVLDAEYAKLDAIVQSFSFAR